MRNTYAILALRRKRAHLAGEIEAAERAVAAQRASLANLDAVIRLFEPGTDPDLIPSIRPVSRRCLFFRNGEQMHLCCDVLRDAGGPMRTHAIAMHVMAAKGLPTDQAAIVQSIAAQVRVALFRLEKKEMVRRILRGPEAWWEMALQDYGLKK